MVGIASPRLAVYISVPGAARGFGAGTESLADPAVALVLSSWAGDCDDETAGLAVWASAAEVETLGARYQAATAEKRQRIPVTIRDEERKASLQKPTRLRWERRGFVARGLVGMWPGRRGGRHQ